MRRRGAEDRAILLWMENQTLQARPFDSDTLQWRGDPVSLAEGVALAGDDIRARGVLDFRGRVALYVRGGNAEPKFPLAWYGNDGRPLGEAAPEGPYNAIAISRDQQHVALSRREFPAPASRMAISGCGTSPVRPMPAPRLARQRMRILSGHRTANSSHSPRIVTDFFSFTARTCPVPARRNG